jgi:hypothetical protein
MPLQGYLIGGRRSADRNGILPDADTLKRVLSGA